MLALLAGCGGGTSGPAGRAVAPRASQGAVGASATTTPASELRAGLTWQLVERVHLLALARQALVQAHGVRSAPEVQAAEELLDAGADDLVGTTGAPALREPLDAEVEAVLAARPGPLTPLHEELAARLVRTAPDLHAPALVEALDRATAGLGAPTPTVDAAGAEVAAGIMTEAVASARRLGSTETSASVLRSDLTRLLVSRTYLVGASADAAALDRLTGVLARRLVDPPAPRGPVVAALRAGHTALFAEAAARAADDRTMTARAGTALLAADRDLARQLSAAVPALQVDVVVRALDPGRAPLLAAVGARAAGDPIAARLSAGAAARAVVLAAALAAGIADQQRLG